MLGVSQILTVTCNLQEPVIPGFMVLQFPSIIYHLLGISGISGSLLVLGSYFRWHIFQSSVFWRFSLALEL